MLITLLAAALAVLPSAGGTDSARAVVRSAVRGVERDGGTVLERAWRARLARSPNDRAAMLGLATLSRLTYRYADAERRYRALADVAGAPADAWVTYARLGIAEQLYDRGLMAASDSEYVLARAAARRTGDPLAEAEALLGLAFLRANSDGIPTGFALVDSAARLIPDSALTVRANYECRRGVLDAVLLRPAAVEEGERGAALARRAGAPRFEAQCLRAQALAFSLRHSPDTALVLLRRTAALERRARDRSALGETLLRIADILRGQGALGDAKAAIDQAMTEAEAAHSQFALASANLNAGALALQLNDRVPAGEYIRRAAEMFAAQEDTSSVMIAHEFLADLDVAAGDYGAARREALETLRWYQHSGEVPRQLEMFQSLATIAMRAHDWNAAARAIADGRALARRHGLPRADDWMAYEEGRLALYRGALDTAERRLGDYLRERAPDEHLHIYEARAHLADVYARRGDAERAERELAAATRELDTWRATLGDAELRVLAFQAGAGEEAEADGVVPRVLASLARAGRADGAFAIAERRRARELADRLAQAGALRAGREGGGRTETGASSARADAGGAQPVNGAAAASALPDEHTALLEFVTGPDDAPTTLFVLTRSRGAPRLRALVLPSADSLAAPIERLDALLAGGTDPRGLERSLGAAVLDPALAAVGPEITRLVIVPDGPLHRLPFAALRLSDGRYAVERLAIGIAPSASVVAALRLRARTAGDVGRARVLAFGDPAYPPAEDTAARAARAAEGSYRAAFDEAGGLPRLAGSAREARLVATYAPGSMVRLREAASAAYLEHAPLGDFDVIHFATHALVDDERLGHSALALSPGGGESGFVTPGDLAALRLRADLVVLSACRTAGGVIVTGEGVQGLTAPLLRAGARAVVATTWRIDDTRTIGFVRRLYDALARGSDVAAALRETQIAAIRSGAPPRDWAAFEVVGDPLVRVPLVMPPRFPAAPGLIALSAALAVAVGLVLALARRRAR
ncbi:MAG TPA: CHAT domain-containing protein [Gemmatimonadaceae bacterium]|nr:CHAT domain-containing protein [Gemmatimonadaceae bacterium]